MNDAKQRIARADQAQRAWDEFFAPMLAEMEAAYTERLVEVANTELHPTNRADKITALSIALKVLANLKGGMMEAIRDGEIANAEQLRVEKIERMSDAQQRLLKVVGY